MLAQLVILASAAIENRVFFHGNHSFHGDWELSGPVTARNSTFLFSTSPSETWMTSRLTASHFHFNVTFTAQSKSTKFGVTLAKDFGRSLGRGYSFFFSANHQKLRFESRIDNTTKGHRAQLFPFQNPSFRLEIINENATLKVLLVIDDVSRPIFSSGSLTQKSWLGFLGNDVIVSHFELAGFFPVSLPPKPVNAAGVLSCYSALSNASDAVQLIDLFAEVADNLSDYRDFTVSVSGQVRSFTESWQRRSLFMKKSAAWLRRRLNAQLNSTEAEVALFKGDIDKQMYKLTGKLGDEVGKLYFAMVRAEFEDNPDLEKKGKQIQGLGWGDLLFVFAIFEAGIVVIIFIGKQCEPEEGFNPQPVPQALRQRRPKKRRAAVSKPMPQPGDLLG
jgi:hypothetical protein